MFDVRVGMGAYRLRRLVLSACVCLVGLLPVAATIAQGTSVYKCTGADGSIAFQSQACAPAQHQGTIELAAPPAYAPSPTYALDVANTGKRHKPRTPRSSAPRAVSFECRASDGQVFYRHRSCPHRIASGDNARKSVSVSATGISREQACTQIRRAGAIGRRGHRHDETVSAYDRNLGRDPCD